MKTAFHYIQEYLIGDFDNQNQIDKERSQGKQIHPYAKHVTRDFNHRIHGLPENFEGSFILEESYYQYPDKELEIKPLLFLFEHVLDDQVRLNSMQIPDTWDKADVRNDNPDLSFHFQDLKPSDRFRPAIYYFFGDHFKVNAPNDLGNGMRFTLIETLRKDRLEVMELLEKDGQRLTPYDTPIIYERIEDS